MASGSSAEGGTEGGEGPPPPKNTGTKTPDEDDTHGEEATPPPETVPPVPESSKRTEKGEKAAGKTPVPTPSIASTSHPFPGRSAPMPLSHDRLTGLQEKLAVDEVPKGAAAPPLPWAESKRSKPTHHVDCISFLKKRLFGELGNDQLPQSKRPSVWMLEIATQHQRLKSNLGRVHGIRTPLRRLLIHLQRQSVGLQVTQQHPQTPSMLQQQLPTPLSYGGSLFGSSRYGPWSSPSSLATQAASSSSSERPPHTAWKNAQLLGDSDGDHGARTNKVKEEVKEEKVEEEVKEEEGSQKEEEKAEADENDTKGEAEDDKYDREESDEDLEDKLGESKPNNDELGDEQA